MNHPMHGRIAAFGALFGSWSMATLAVAAPPTTAPVDPPQYKLTVGQELTYTTRTESSAGRGGAFTNVVVYHVVGHTADGAGWHLVSQASRGRTTELSAFDLWPDGRQGLDKTNDGPLVVDQNFPPLPVTPTVDRWDAPVADGRAIYHPSPTTRPASVAFTAVKESDLDAVYKVNRTETDTFDVSRGLLVHRAGQTVQDYHGHQVQTWTRDLTGDTVRPAEWTAAYDAAAAGTLSAIKAHDDALAASVKAADPAAAQRDALDKLVAAAAAMREPAFAATLRNQVKQHPQAVEELTDEAQARATLVGRPAPDWDLVDLTGKRHALAELRGQVVVLDFWYRGCVWCMRAMPQVKQLAEDYKGRPVAFLGMNDDQQLKDAQVVADFFALPYPTLRMLAGNRAGPTSRPAVDEEYLVKGYPTMILIGPDGVIRDVHVGYTPTLHDDVTQSINALLPNAAAHAAR